MSEANSTAEFLDSVLGDEGFDEPAQTATVAGATSNALGSPFDVLAFCQRHGIKIKDTKKDGGTTLYVLEPCEFDSSHKGKDAAIKQESSGRLGYKCFH